MVEVVLEWRSLKYREWNVSIEDEEVRWNRTELELNDRWLPKRKAVERGELTRGMGTKEETGSLRSFMYYLDLTENIK